MYNMALTTSKINMQEHYEDSPEGEEFGHPSDAEWQRNVPIPIREGSMEGMDDPGLCPSPLELNSCRKICPEDKIHYHTDMSDAPVLVSSAQIKELASCNKRKSYKSGYMATSYETIPALPELQDQVGVGLIARRCKQARLSREAAQAVNQHDASVPQHQSKTASDWVSDQQPTHTIIQDTPNLEG